MATPWRTGRVLREREPKTESARERGKERDSTSSTEPGEAGFILYFGASLALKQSLRAVKRFRYIYAPETSGLTNCLFIFEKRGSAEADCLSWLVWSAVCEQQHVCYTLRMRLKVFFVATWVGQLCKRTNCQRTLKRARIIQQSSSEKCTAKREKHTNNKNKYKTKHIKNELHNLSNWKQRVEY